MGATLEFRRVRANNYVSAIRQLEDQQMSLDPYSGDFNTCHDYYNKSNSFESADDFADWVKDEGEKREAYFYRLDSKRWLVGGWCAC